MTTQISYHRQKSATFALLSMLGAAIIVGGLWSCQLALAEEDVDPNALILEDAMITAATDQPVEVEARFDAFNDDLPEDNLSEESVDWFTREQLSGRIEMGDFVVGPGRSVLELRPGETVTVQLSVSNRISNNRRFDLKVEDIAGSQNPIEGIQALGDTIGPYSIRDYISFPHSSFELGLGERARIPVTISIPPDAEPGGYYGAIFVTTTRIETDVTESDATTAQSPIIARIGSQFFITVPGEVEVGSVVRDVSLVGDRWWYERGPIQVALTTENTGSIHLVMGADMIIRNMFGEEVGVSEIDPWFVLPKSLRLRTLSWDREFLLGRYTAEVRLARGHDDIVDTFTLVFWVLPWRIVGGVFLGLFILIFAIRAFFRTFEFKRKPT